MEDEWGAGLMGEDWASILETEAPIAGSPFPHSYLSETWSGAGGNIHSSQPSSNKTPSKDYSKGALATGADISSIPTAAPTAPRSMMQQPLRKSCEFCRLRKKKCDGDGLNRCSLCVTRGNDRCVYIERISSAPKNPARSAKRSKSKQAAAKGKEKPASSRVSKGNVPEIPRAGESKLVPLKRCRLSASPATGMVGMQENIFLSDYFECMGLLPLTSERDVRQAMVSVMVAALSPDQRKRHTSVRPHPPVETPEEPRSERGLVAFGAPSGINIEALTCSLWCAVALGALVRGWPSSSVMRYVELARESLTGCFDDASVDTLRAYVLMAFLHNFLGEEKKFQKYLMFAHGTARALPIEGVPGEVFDLLSLADSAALFSGVAPTLDELEAFCRPGEGEIKAQAPTVSRKMDFCRFLLQADHRLDQAFYQDMRVQGVLDPTRGSALSEEQQSQEPLPSLPQQVQAEWVDDDEEEDEGGYRVGDRRSRELSEDASWGRPHGNSGGVGRDGGIRTMPKGSSGRRVLGVNAGSEVRLVLKLEEGTDPEPPPPGEHTLRMVMEEMAEMRRLEEEGKWPDTQNGIGGFLYNTRLAFQAFMVQERPFGFKALEVTMKVLLQNPGLLRFSSWLHMTHCVLALFAELETGDCYTRLRELYNRMKPTGLTPAPPFEEFQGMSDICQHIFCRSCLSKRWVKNVDTAKNDGGTEGGESGNRPEAPNFASAETSNPPTVSSWEGTRPVNLRGSDIHDSHPRTAQADLSVAAAAATVNAQIGIPRVVLDDVGPPEGSREPGPWFSTGTQRVGNSSNNEDRRSSATVSRSLPDGERRPRPPSEDGSSCVPLRQMPGTSVEKGETGRQETQGNIHRSGAMLPMAPEGLNPSALGVCNNDGGPVSFDASECLLLEKALLGDESAEEEMWALGAGAMGLKPSHP